VRKISKIHKELIVKTIESYTEADFENTLKRLTPVLRDYHQGDPSKIGKRLLNRLFSTWLNKPQEAIIHYWTVCKLIFEYQYPSEQIDIEVPCGNIGRKALDPVNFGETHADIVVYT